MDERQQRLHVFQVEIIDSKPTANFLSTCNVTFIYHKNLIILFIILRERKNDFHMQLFLHKTLPVADFIRTNGAIFMSSGYITQNLYYFQELLP